MKEYQSGFERYKLSFLTLEQLFEFKKDTCIFCNGKFPVREFKDNLLVNSSCAGNRYEDLTYNYSSIPITRTIAMEKDLIYFHLVADPKQLRLAGQDLYDQLKKDKSFEVDKLKAKYSRMKSLSESEKQIALDALIKNLIKDFESEKSSGPKINQDINDTIYHLAFGDLFSIFVLNNYLHFSGYSNWNRSIDEKEIPPDRTRKINPESPSSLVMEDYFFPRGIKAHKHCYPFEDSPKTISLAHLLEKFQSNPLFSDYKSDFASLSGAAGYLQHYFNRLTLEIIPHAYDPFDWVNLPKNGSNR